MRFVRHAPVLALAGIGTVLFGAASEIQSLLANRVDEGQKVVGIVVGTVGPDSREVIPYGTMARDRTDPVNGDTLFEIGSITKVFTSLILADMVVHNEVKLDTPVAALLPKSVKVPRRDGKQITLLDLAMHLSGLPRMPPGFKPADMENPFVGFGTAQLYEFLSGYTLTREIGSQYEYSNLGAGLLGHALTCKTGLTFGELLRRRVLDPLGMTSTGIILSDDQRRRLATGYDGALFPAKNWDFDALAGAGAMRSTANDLLKFLAANLELTHTPLTPAMRLMRSMRHPAESPDMEIMLGWHVWKRYGAEIIWHNGVTGGYWSFIGFDPVKKIGSVVLSNTRYDNDAIGLHALDKDWPVEKLNPPKPRVPRDIDPAILSRYVGVYRFGSNYTVQVSLEYGQLWVRDNGDKVLQLLAEKEDEFFFQSMDVQVTFERNAEGKISRMILHVNGEDSIGTKVQ
ncbi:MAG TPA: serine hydrolase [Bryobacteraceae bacterium]|jgi:CubicO group peptidase (beta-lactamase class C family)